MTPVKFLFEVGVGIKAEQAVADLGFDVKSLPDPPILRLAREESRILVTMDKDFGELVYRSQHGHVGVLLLRMDDADGDAKANAIRLIVQNHAHELAGHFCVYQNGVLRIR